MNHHVKYLLVSYVFITQKFTFENAFMMSSVQPFCPSKKTLLTWLCRDILTNISMFEHSELSDGRAREVGTAWPIFLSNKSRLNEVSEDSALKLRKEFF